MQQEALKSQGLVGEIITFKERMLALAEKNRARHEAKELAKVLLRIPRKDQSVFHETDIEIETTGSTVHVKLCNTANADSVRGLLDARHGADRIDLSEVGGQSMMFGFLGNEIQYSDYYQYHGQAVQHWYVFADSLSEGGYYASIDQKKVPFDARFQRQVYGNMANTFRDTRIALSQS